MRFSNLPTRWPEINVALRPLILLQPILAACVTSSPLLAQSTISPPRQDSSSPIGVSFRSGSLSLSEQDLSIGGDGPEGLTLSRVYNSGVLAAGSTSASVPGVNWDYDVRGYITVEALPLYPDPENQPRPGEEPYIYNVVLGSRSIGFLGGSTYSTQSRTGGPVGTYQPALPSGAQLIFNGSNSYANNYVFTDSDGSVVTFSPGFNTRIVSWVMPDGTRRDYSYSGNTLKEISTNRGWALLFESATKVCAVNLAQYYITPASSCPAGAQTVTYTQSAGTFNTPTSLLTSVTRDGRTTTYSYNNKDHLNCVIGPGDTSCRVATTYATCPEDPAAIGLQYQLHLHDYVVSQVDATGKTYTYTYGNNSYYPAACPKWESDENPDYRTFNTSTATLTEGGTIVTSMTIDPSGVPQQITDPLGRQKAIYVASGFVTASFAAGFVPDAVITGIRYPESNDELFLRDARGNFISRTMRSKPGSGLADIVVTASYPSNCTNAKTCNKPVWIRDAKGAQTDYTYDAVHGGLLTETGPADAGGVRPVKRFAYAQRYAWISNGAGGYMPASSPVWVKTEERACRTSATVGNACSAGSADEVVTAYDYGPNSGPNNLLLRGVAVSADGVTLRTCYAYDTQGNRISETSPRAGLAVCP